MRIYFPILIIMFLTANNSQLNAQGCSDAGICTLNALKPKSETDFSTNHLKFGVTNGLADYDISVNGVYVEYGRNFSKTFGIDAKIAALGQFGNGISTFGLSDIYLNVNYRLGEKSGLTAGVKVPLSLSDKRKDGRPLPMDYQSSLGTIDFVLGISHEFGRLQVVAALQQPLTDNENTFMPEDWPLDSKLREIPTTNRFQRAGDVLLRLSYPIILSKKISLTPSILPIYHLAQDKYLTTYGEIPIIGSDGFTLNGNVFVDYKLNEKSKLQLSLASPFIVRETRPDGLTRGYVVGLEYGVSF